MCIRDRIMTLDIFIKNYIRKSSPKTIHYMINTLGIASVAFLFIALRPVQNIIMSYPEIIIITLVINFVIGLSLIHIFLFSAGMSLDALEQGNFAPGELYSFTITALKPVERTPLSFIEPENFIWHNSKNIVTSFENITVEIVAQ